MPDFTYRAEKAVVRQNNAKHPKIKQTAAINQKKSPPSVNLTGS